MAHPDQLKFIRFFCRDVPDFFENARVLEVGSLDINGSVRPFFSDCDYLGIDVGAGRGVDRVIGGQDLDAPDAFFDVVVSCECMEHNPYWAETIENMIRVLRPGGLLLLSFAGYGRPEHGTSHAWPEASPLTIEKNWDHYRNLGRGEMNSLTGLRTQFAHLFMGENASFCDFYVAGLKQGTGPKGTMENSDSLEFHVESFDLAVRRVRHWLRRRNRGWRARCRLFASRIAGERGVQHCCRIERWFNPEFVHEALSLPNPAPLVSVPRRRRRRAQKGSYDPGRGLQPHPLQVGTIRFDRAVSMNDDS